MYTRLRLLHFGSIQRTKVVLVGRTHSGSRYLFFLRQHTARHVGNTGGQAGSCETQWAWVASAGFAVAAAGFAAGFAAAGFADFAADFAAAAAAAAAAAGFTAGFAAAVAADFGLAAFGVDPLLGTPGHQVHSCKYALLVGGPKDHGGKRGQFHHVARGDQ